MDLRQALAAGAGTYAPRSPPASSVLEEVRVRSTAGSFGQSHLEPSQARGDRKGCRNMIDQLFWWTGATLWMIAAGCPVGFILFAMWVAFKAAVFTKRVIDANIRQNGVRARLKFWWWAFKTVPDACEVETSEGGWTTVYFPGVEPLDE